METSGYRVDNKYIGEKLFGVATLAAISGILITIAFLSFSRIYFDFGVETDYLTDFKGDASSFLSGAPLSIEYHPPLYSITIALVQSLTGDWFLTGRLVSFFAAAITLFTSYIFFYLTLSRAAALGSLITLLASTQFLTASTVAASDIFFLALYMSSLLASLVATRRQTIFAWFGAGFIIGLTLLSRTNAIGLLLLLLVPWWESDKPIQLRVLAAIVMVVGVAVPLLGWGYYVLQTGTPVFPSGTYISLAWTYFPPEGATAWLDSVQYAKETFSNTWQVIAHDPIRMLRIYAENLYDLPRHLAGANNLAAYPLNLLVLPALLYLLYSANSRWTLFAVIIAIGQIAIINLTTFQPRYYLFLVPLVGGAMGHMFGELVSLAPRLDSSELSRRVSGVIAVAIAILAVMNSVRHTHYWLNKNVLELQEAVSAATEIIPPNALVIARKPVIPFYTDGEYSGMPAGDSLSDLYRYLLTQSHGRDVFIYYGSAERRLRPEYSELLSSDNIPWLELVASSAQPAGWVLYRYNHPVGEGR